jgi:hypothetical protein
MVKFGVGECVSVTAHIEISMLAESNSVDIDLIVFLLKVAALSGMIVGLFNIYLSKIVFLVFGLWSLSQFFLLKIIHEILECLPFFSAGRSLGVPL